MDHSNHGSHGSMGNPATPAPDSSAMNPVAAAGHVHDGMMDHSKMNHGAMSMDHGMMKMSFHFGLGDTCLFEGWTLDDAGDMVVACLVFFIVAFAYEGLKSYRESLIKRDRIMQRSFPITVIGGGGDLVYRTANGGNEEVNITNGRGSSPIAAVTREPGSIMFSIPHATQTLLHIVQVFTSYILMLVFMTFNGYLCISVLLGAGVGYFAFCWRRFTVIDEREHCH